MTAPQRPYREPAPVERMLEIAGEVAVRESVGVGDLTGPCIARWALFPRQEAMALIYATGCFSTPQIGDFFGFREHSTVIRAIRRYWARQGVSGARAQ